MKTITELEGFVVGQVYKLTAGYYKDRLFHLEYISPFAYNRMVSGRLVDCNTRINTQFTSLGTNTPKGNDRQNLLRQKAQQMLKNGNKAAALQLLKTAGKK